MTSTSTATETGSPANNRSSNRFAHRGRLSKQPRWRKPSLAKSPGSPPNGTAQNQGLAAAPGVRRPPIGGCHLIGAVADCVAQPDQNVVQRSCRLLPAGL